MTDNYLGQYLQTYERQRYTLLDRYSVALRSILVEPDYVTFPDVSFYQGPINWQTFRSKSDKVCIRAGQNTWIDKEFTRNWAEAKRLGIQRSSYWFYDGRISPGVQAELWAGLLKNDPPELPIFADWERSYSGAYEGLEQVVAFMQAVERLTGKVVGLYTGYYWFMDHSSAATHASQYTYLKQRPLWLAWYASPTVVKVPAPWSDWTFWQYGTPQVGQEYGTGTIELDMNRFNGNEARWDAVFPAQDIPQGDPTMATYNVKGTLNIRSAATVNSVDIGDLLAGDQVEGTVIQVSLTDKWLRISKITRAGFVPLPAPICYVSLNTTNTVEVPATTTDTTIKLSYDSANKLASVVVDGVTWVKQ